MLCPKCKKEVSSDDRFCHYCGENLEGLKKNTSKDMESNQIKCKSCGKYIDNGSVFCDQCGVKVENDDINNRSIEASSKNQAVYSKFKFPILEIIVLIGSVIYSFHSLYTYYIIDPSSVPRKVPLGLPVSQYMVDNIFFIVDLFLYSGIIVIILFIIVILAIYLLHKHQKSGLICLAISGISYLINGAFMIIVSETVFRELEYYFFRDYAPINNYSVLGTSSVIFALLIFIIWYLRSKEASKI